MRSWKVNLSFGSLKKKLEFDLFEKKYQFQIFVVWVVDLIYI